MSEQILTYQQAVKAMLNVYGKTQHDMCAETGIDYSTLKKLNAIDKKPSRLIHYTIMNYLKEQGK